MFSQEDVLDIYQWLPPAIEPQSKHIAELPLLINTNSGHYFVTAHSLDQNFKNLVTGKVTRIPVSDACSELNVGLDVVSQLIRANPGFALTSRDGNSIVPKQERDAIVRDLEQLLSKELVVKDEFLNARDIQQESLEHILSVSSIKQSLEDVSGDYLLSNMFSRALSKELCQKLKEGLNNNETIELRPQLLPGSPPIWFIRRCLDQLSSDTANGIDFDTQFHVASEAETISCIPRKSILSQRDELIDGLQSGKSFCLDVAQFRREYGELYPSPDAIDAHLSGTPSVTIINGFAVSTERISALAGDAAQSVSEHGYVDFKSIVSDDIPHGIEENVRDIVTHKLLDAESDSDKYIKVSDYLFSDRMYRNQQQALLAIAKAQADRQWGLFKEATDKDPKFQMVELMASIPAEDHVLHTFASQKEAQVAASEQFSGEISDLEKKNEHDFTIFWAERVSLRAYNYHKGLKSVEDAKLHEQLSDLLSNYLQKEFMPDMISKARSQGLVRSRRTRKNINRFEAMLKASTSDLTSIFSILERFGKKQGLPDIVPEAAEEAKNSSIQDMIRRMQKPKTDAPSTFLSLVVILFAKHHPGLVYATGKFAPKLLKQLRANLSDAGYEQVDRWKEQAKAGTLSKEHRASMVHMAEQQI